MSKKAKLIVTLSTSIIMISLFIFLIFIFSLRLSHRHFSEIQGSDHAITKRRLPYPFKSAITISSDIDYTNSLEEFLIIQEFLNTRNKTDMGVGLGLEIGNCFFPIKTSKTSSSPFGLISNNQIDNEVIVELIKLGYIDSIHSFQEANRREIRKITNILSNSGCQLDVWVNHAIAPTNLGYREDSLGDNINSNHYHTDFSIKSLRYKFVEIGGVSCILGQGVPIGLHSFFAGLDRKHFVKSLYRNVFKEIGKYALSYVVEKYSNRKHNDLTFPLRLDDGQYVFGFIRSNVSYRGIQGMAVASTGLVDIIREDILRELNKNGGYMIVYTHLGMNAGYPYISKATQKALRLLEREFRKGNTYITTTAKLLKYYVNNKYLVWHASKNGNDRNIHIVCISDPVRGTFVPTIDDLKGITFYTIDPANTHIFIQDKEISEIIRNERDYTMNYSVMIPLKPLPKLDNKMKEYKKKGYFGSYSMRDIHK